MNETNETTHPKYLHNYMSTDLEGEHRNRTTMRNVFYNNLEDIPLPIGPEDQSMYNAVIYELSLVPREKAYEAKRKQREDAEYKQYLKLKAKYENK